MSEFIVGISASPDADAGLMRQAGITHVRQSFGYPFKDALGGELSDRYVQAKATAQRWLEKGFGLMGGTPLIGSGLREPDGAGHLRFVFHERYPQWMGKLGSDAFLDSYEAVCRFLAEDVGEMVDVWQIANEPDIPIFAGPLRAPEACELVQAGARGLKTGDGAAVVGTNLAGGAYQHYFLGRLFADELLDYCGVDAYYGTWQEGGPDDWASRIPELHELSGRPVLVNEWGYASAGEVMTEAQRATEAWPCEFKRWRYGWGEGHTEAAQAAFVARAMSAFAAHQDKMLGAFFYRWEDQARCWQCGEPDCPAETAWGLVDQAGRPKPSWQAMREGTKRILTEG